jgi:antitoxin component YwqK of YwqJK toxin-antitoxin module
VNGQREGTHTYWYENGKMRGVGGFKNDAYEGSWTMYAEDGTQQSVQTYQAGKLVK